MTLTVMIVYLALVVSIGVLSHRRFRNTSDDYFVASRSIGPFVLLMTLFGTNMTAFAILGASGEAYRQGIGVFALFVTPGSIMIPLIFLFFGTRLWALGKKFGYRTQIQYFRDRFESNNLGLLPIWRFLLSSLPRWRPVDPWVRLPRRTKLPGLQPEP